MSGAFLPAVILAGGGSQRMGFPKVQLTISGKPVILSMMQKLQSTGWRLECVVVPNDSLAGWATRTTAGVKAVVNPYPMAGMISSIRLSLSQLAADSPGALIWPVDRPMVAESVLEMLRRAAEPSVVAAPTFGGRRGHPTWWGGDYWSLLRSDAAEQGANALLRRRDVTVAEVAVDEESIHWNVDTPQDAAAHNLKRWEP